MLAKLKVLRQEDKALQEIETKLRAQLNRLKQEERVLRRQMRKSQRQGLNESDQANGNKDFEETEQDVDNDQMMNQAPLMDLNEAAISILQAQMGQGHYVQASNNTDEEEEEEEEEEVEEHMDYSGMTDVRRGDDEEEDEGDEDDDVHDEIGAEYRKLFMEMKAEVDYEEEFEDG